MQRRLFLETAAQIFMLPCGPILLSSPVSALALPAPSDLLVSFGIVTDIHYAERNNSGHEQKGNLRAYRDSVRKLDQAVSVFNERNVSFAIELGDFTDRKRSDTREEVLKYVEEAEKSFARFHGPRYHVAGNHDFSVLTLADFLDVTPNAGDARGKNWYGFSASGIRFLVLDCNYNNRDGDHYGPGRYDWGTSWVPEEELQWLKTELASGTEPVIVFTHQLLNFQDAGQMCPKREFVRNAGEVVELLENSSRVLAVFSGHWHRGGYAEHNGIHYVVCHGMILGEMPHNSYCIVHIDRQANIYVEGFVDQPSHGMPPREKSS